MEIKHEIPQIYYKCRDLFGVDWNSGVIITYGSDVYCKFDISLQKMTHEAVHIHQQTTMGVDIWWNKYFDDKEFRLSQEMEAYKREAQFIKQTMRDRNQRFRAIRQIALDLSGPMYGNIITYNEAFKELNK